MTDVILKVVLRNLELEGRRPEDLSEEELKLRIWVAKLSEIRQQSGGRVPFNIWRFKRTLLAKSREELLSLLRKLRDKS